MKHRRIVGFVVLVDVGVAEFVLCSSVRPRILLGLGIHNLLVVVSTVAEEMVYLGTLMDVVNLVVIGRSLGRFLVVLRMLCRCLLV